MPTSLQRLPMCAHIFPLRDKSSKCYSKPTYPNNVDPKVAGESEVLKKTGEVNTLSTSTSHACKATFPITEATLASAVQEIGAGKRLAPDLAVIWGAIRELKEWLKMGNSP